MTASVKHTLAKGALEDIENYYRASFKLPPDRCLPFLQSFFFNIKELLPHLGPSYTKRMETHLERLSLTLSDNNKDYVLLRDLLWYEIRPLLRNL